MKRLDGLWPRVVAFDNLWRAWRKARRGKSRGAGAVAFELDLEHNLLTLQRDLDSGDYRPGDYRLFTIYERKPRLIAAAPFPDRVVHHAVMNVIEPPLDRRFIADSYACRKGKGVTWHDAVAYCAWLSQETGSAYRLPSEAEWEYACRAGTATAFWWGDDIDATRANYDGTGTYRNEPPGEYRRQTVPVDAFQPNPFGLYQVHGNVWEWVQDCYHLTYDGAPGDGSAWEEEDCRSRVLRGGSWFLVPLRVRGAARLRDSPHSRCGSYGFRLARTFP